MTTKKSSKTTNKQNPNRKILDAKKIEPKWFIYQASNIKGMSFTAKFVPVPEEVTTTVQYKVKRAFCLEMFCEGITRVLGFCLDPNIHKRYQGNVCVGALDIDYFNHYFGATNANIPSVRSQYFNFNGKRIYVNCPGFTFKGFQNLPNFNKSNAYASANWSVTTNRRINDYEKGIYYYKQMVDLYQIYFSELTFYCNPVTNLVHCNYEIVKQHWNPEYRIWESI